MNGSTTDDPAVLAARSLGILDAWCAEHPECDNRHEPEERPMTAAELRTWRTSRGLKQADAARLLGIGERRLRDLETRALPVPERIAAVVAGMTRASSPSPAPGPAPLPVKPQVPRVELDATCRVFDVQRWAKRLPSNAEPLAAHALGVSLRVLRHWTTAAPADAPIPRRVADRLRALSPQSAGPFLSRDLTAWRERFSLSPETASDVLGVPVNRIVSNERQAWAMLPPDIAGALANQDAG